MVAMEDSSGDLVYYEYVRPACVEMEFFENAKTIANSRYGIQKNNGESTHLMCANPKSLAAAPMCCDKTDQRTYRKGASECVYESERVSFSTAEARCAQTQGKELCEWGQSSTTYASSTPRLPEILHADISTISTFRGLKGNFRVGSRVCMSSMQCLRAEMSRIRDSWNGLDRSDWF